MEVNHKHKLTENEYEKLIDIYFHESSVENSQRINIERKFVINLIGVEFQDDAYDILDSYAFVKNQNQIYALQLLLSFALTNLRREKTLTQLHQNIKNFDERIRHICCDYLIQNFVGDNLAMKSVKLRYPEPEVEKNSFWKNLFKKSQ